ncbi:monothiol glutaredoxin-S12, chloroplastic [Cocos nucifera]|uniref:Monothiol glutaredoxin-S12, chloroplastic n=1 Tax=Cocos nucifera TaxID=13894 RepID=A0A8K0I4Z1_COCNU|nr:monothiol glutaredoxin-S12, chloroplastic [Cocos nucifera]
MAGALHLCGLQSFSPLRTRPSAKSFPSFSSSLPSAPSSLAHLCRAASLRSFSSSARRRPSATAAPFSAALGKLSETELVPVPKGPDGLNGKFPSAAGVYGIYDGDGGLQFIGISRNVAASIAAHAKSVPDLCCAVKVGLVDEAAPDRTVLTSAWKSWLEEYIAATGKVPPGNETGNNTWFRLPQRKPDLRLTPGRHVKLTVPLEVLIDQLVKENKVVAFIKGSRSAPQCGFSQRVVGILESHGVDFECVDVLDEEHNHGLRQTLKKYSNWPTFPQVFVGGELVGGCDIISSMAEKGELAALFQK